MRLATKIFLLLFGLFFATISLDIAAQYYFYDFAYPSYKQNQIYQLVYEIKEDMLNIDFYSPEFISYLNDVKDNHLVEYDIYSPTTTHDYITKVLFDFLNRRAFENWTTRTEADLRSQIVKFLDSVMGPNKLRCV